MTEPNNLGFYGKIPSNGDFISRRLPRTFMVPWDQWLQESIVSSREQLGDHWLDSYLTAPIWRFALSRGVCGHNAWIGLVMPSVDRVGRHFPLTLAAPVNDSHSLLSIADNEGAWFSQAEHIALSALDQNNSLDAFSQDIDNLEFPSHLSAPPKAQQDESIKPGLTGSDHWHIAMTASAPISSSLTSLIDHYLVARFPDFSLWWTNGSEQVEPSILVCNKLPPTQGFTALLSGNWDHWGWANRLNSRSPISNNHDNTTVRTA